MARPGDVVDPYVADSARDEVHALRDMSAQLSDWLYVARQGISTINAVRSQSFEFDYPNLEEAAEAAAELNQAVELIDNLANAFEAAVEELDEGNEDAANDAD